MTRQGRRTIGLIIILIGIAAAGSVMLIPTPMRSQETEMTSQNDTTQYNTLTPEEERVIIHK